MYSFKWLADAMQKRILVQLCGEDCKACSGTISGIAIEDGSGNNWLVTIALTGGGVKTIFVRAK